MIKLFSIGDDYLVSLDTEWLSTIKEFKSLLSRDRSKTKEKARKEFTYIYHLMDFRSPYENFPSDERKENAIKESELTQEMLDDPLVHDALIKYQSLLENSSPSLRMLRAVKASLKPMEDYFINFNPIEPNDLKDHITNIKNLPGMQKALKEYEEQVKLEALEEGSIRGQAEKGYKEDPD